MPNKTIKGIAKHTGLSTSTIDKEFKEGEKAAEKSYKKPGKNASKRAKQKFYGTAMMIAKRKMKAHHGVQVGIKESFNISEQYFNNILKESINQE